MADVGKIRTVVVTGASGGVGESICLNLIRGGYHVIGLDKKDGVIKPNKYYKHIIIDLNLYTTDLNYQNKINKEIKNLSSNKVVYALINNAAIQIKKKLEDVTIYDWYSILNVNVLAPYFISKNLFKYLKRNQGYIINISSIHDKLSKKNFGAYSVSKTALSGLSRAMVLEWGEFIKIVTISPAAIDTQMLRSGFDKNFADIRNKLKICHPSNTIGKPSDISNLINFILTGSADFINGAIIHMDGGISHRLFDIEV